MIVARRRDRAAAAAPVRAPGAIIRCQSLPLGIILPHLESRACKRLARAILRRAALSFPLQRTGRRWDRQDEIDVIGLNDDVNAILLAEVQWAPPLRARPAGRLAHALTPVSRVTS